MKPSLQRIVSTFPSPIDAVGAAVVVNRACGIEVGPVNGTMQTKGIPTEDNSYTWSAIFAEMTAQGYVPTGGEFVRA